MICEAACSERAIQRGPQRVDHTKCDPCGHCAEACPHEALRLVGREENLHSLLQVLLADRPYYEATHGGVTLSGGEPLVQADACASLLERCQEAGIHTLIETCGAVPWSAFETVLPHTDLFYFDLKASPDKRHKELTGASLRPIFDNAKRLARTGADISFRMPVVPGLNDSPADLEGIAGLVRECGHETIRLLPYHSGGESKIPRLRSGQRPLGLDISRAAMAVEEAARVFGELGVQAEKEGAASEEPDPPREDLFPRRVWDLRQAVQSATPGVCAERALLVTRFHRRQGRRREPAVVQQARALAYLLGQRAATIYDDELLVGCFSTRRVGGAIFPELHGLGMLEDLFSFGRRALNPMQLKGYDRAALALRVMPFWLNKFLAIRAFPRREALRFTADQLRGQRYLINETGGISHFVPDLQSLLQKGTSGLIQEAEQRRAATDDPLQRDFYRAVQIVCEGLERLAENHARAAEELASQEDSPARQQELKTIAQVCGRVPRLPARTLREAFQAVLWAQIALNQESLDNSVCPGRLDQVLNPYFQGDLQAGRLDREGAAELVGCFTVKMSEIVPVFSRRLTRFHGGLFNGQVVVVGGVDREGRDATNDLTWIFLDAMDALRMRQPNYHARIHQGSPRPYVRRVAAMLRDGSAAPSLFNDEVTVPMLVERGVDLLDARDYSPVGCVEPVACGLTYGSTDAALLNLALCLERALGLKQGSAPSPILSGCRTILQVWERFKAQVEHLVRKLMHDLQAIERANARFHPTPLTSTLLGGCLETGTDASAGGAQYNSSGVQGVGVVDVGDSITALEQVVFRRQLCDLSTLVDALKTDFSGEHAHLRGHLLKAPKYGNGDPLADANVRRVMEVFAGALSSYENTRGGKYWAGFYSVTAHQAFGSSTGALPSGRRAAAPLANGLSPQDGMDRLGPTATLGSAASLDQGRLAKNGLNLNLKLDRGTLKGDKGVDVVEGLIHGYFQQGGMQAQFNILDPEILQEARDHPDRHPWLLVRVSGYSAYFNDLSPEMKQEIIDRSIHSPS